MGDHVNCQYTPYILVGNQIFLHCLSVLGHASNQYPRLIRYLGHRDPLHPHGIWDLLYTA